MVFFKLTSDISLNIRAIASPKNQEGRPCGRTLEYLTFRMISTIQKKKLGLDGWVASFYRTFQVSYWNIETYITGSCVRIALDFLT